MTETPDGFTELDRCKCVALSTDSAKQLQSRAAIFDDLRFVLRTCDLLIRHFRGEVLPELLGSDGDAPLVEALWTAILIAYERCFSTGQRKSLQYSDLTCVDPSGNALKLHKHYEGMRNRHPAHSVNPFAQLQVVAVLSSASSRRRDVEGIRTLSLRHIAATEEEVVQLRVLVLQLLQHVANECNSLAKEKVLQEARDLDVEELYSQEEAYLRVPGPGEVWTSRGQ